MLHVCVCVSVSVPVRVYKAVFVCMPGLSCVLCVLKCGDASSVCFYIQECMCEGVNVCWCLCPGLGPGHDQSIWPCAERPYVFIRCVWSHQ